ncbi:MAG: hypothetical protein GY946_11775 [bacterium]|nr:hypothetical protein [bacterium]
MSTAIALCPLLLLFYVSFRKSPIAQSQPVLRTVVLFIPIASFVLYWVSRQYDIARP